MERLLFALASIVDDGGSGGFPIEGLLLGFKAERGGPSLGSPLPAGLSIGCCVVGRVSCEEMLEVELDRKLDNSDRDVVVVMSRGLLRERLSHVFVQGSLSDTLDESALDASIKVSAIGASAGGSAARILLVISPTTWMSVRVSSISKRSFVPSLQDNFKTEPLTLCLWRVLQGTLTFPLLLSTSEGLYFSALAVRQRRPASWSPTNLTLAYLAFGSDLPFEFSSTIMATDRSPFLVVMVNRLCRFTKDVIAAECC